MDLAIELRDVSFSHGSVRVLDGLTLSVAAGETLVLLGRSGSGKTTALRLINRLIEPQSGEVRIEGRASTDWDPIELRRRIGYVIQSGGLFPHLTVGENVALPLETAGRTHVAERVHDALRLANLDPDSFRSRYPDQLSGGQRQRASIARALALDPPILLFDEPFSALDPILRASLRRQFLLLRDRWRKTAVFVTHDLNEATEVGHRIALLKSGRLDLVVAAEDFAEARSDEARAFQEAFWLTPSSR